MAPALTKTTKSGIHLSSSLLTDSMGSDSPVTGIDIDPQMKLLEDSYSQRMWLDLSSLPFLDTCGSKNPLEYPDVLLQPLLQGSGYYKTVLLSNPRAVVGHLAINKTKKSLIAQGDILLPPLPDFSSRNAPAGLKLRQLSSTVPESLGISNSPSLIQGNPGDHSRQSSAAGFANATDRKCAGDSMGIDGNPARHWGPRCSQRQPGLVSVEEAVRGQTLRHLSQHGTLVGRAERIQRRLQALLGEHASRHCTQQLEGLKAKFLQKDLTPISPQQPTSPFAAGSPASSTDSKSICVKAESDSMAAVTMSNTTQTGAVSTESSVDVQNFARCASAALRGVQSALDSDATESSSDEEWEPKASGTRTQSVRGSSEWRWHAERAELASRWTWLQLRVAELEGHIRQIGGFRQRVLHSKGGVVLAESQPLTDRQIQQALLTETAGLSFAAGSAGELTSDLEMEPSSPTRLLRNIERQSAQLTQIVNSLMPPLSLSPSSSPVSSWMAAGQQKRPFDSSGGMFQMGSQGMGFDGQKKRRVCRRRPRAVQPDLTCVSARTRPLLTYHKPRLFISNPPCSSDRQEEPFPSSTCSSCKSCDPLALCTDPRCPGNPADRALRSHPVLSLRSDIPLSIHLQNGLQREDWTLRPLTLHPEPSSPLHYLSCGRKQPRNSAAFNLGHIPLPHRRRPKSRGGATEVRWEPGVRDPPRQNRQRRRRRRKRLDHHSSLDEVELLSCFAVPPSPEESAEEAPHPHHTRHRSSQFIRRRNGESVYNINNIVIPMSLAAPIKVEKLQYRDILTPSWRVVETELLLKEEEEEQERVEEEDDETESLSDELFARRHQSYERREKLRWTTWEKNRKHRRSRSSCAGHPTPSADGSGRDCSVRPQTHPHPDWGCWGGGGDSDGELEEKLPQVPWEMRAFPLSVEEEEALRSDGEEEEEEEEEPLAAAWLEGERSDSSGMYSGSEMAGPTVPSSGRRRKRTWKTPRLQS
ncbi:KAT8 regulatory NSL complex subunit 1-like protein isoform X1 [Alosa pseudoharengus]|uniref:KAT8 regulatory NSL complex subunit 1-like protein isoform X1 n=1 Tax=Alosa pseudoharengus TaxID=34774 RepID=UPI003F8903C2